MNPTRLLTDDEIGQITLVRAGIGNLITVLGRIGNDRTVEEALHCLELCDLWLLKAQWPREPTATNPATADGALD